MADGPQSGGAAPVDAERLLGLLGLARRAGKLAMGISAVEQSVRRGEKPLIIVARDMGAAQKGKVVRLEPVRGLVDDVVVGADLAAALGREKLTVVSVADMGFVKGIEKLGAGSPGVTGPGGAPAGRKRTGVARRDRRKPDRGGPAEE